jgi:hypothetical protein
MPTRWIARLLGLTAFVAGCQAETEAPLVLRCGGPPTGPAVASSALITNAEDVSRYLVRTLRADGLMPPSPVEARILLRLDERGEPVCYLIAASAGEARLDALIARAAMRAKFATIGSGADTWVVIPIVVRHDRT